LRKRKQEAELEEAHFEQNMFLINPEMYRQYMKNKEDNSENEGIAWGAPESIEEQQELQRIFEEINQQLDSDEDKKANEEFVNQLGIMNIFNGIDIDKIGGD